MAENLHKGDEVTWQSHGQTVHGKVEKKVTSRTHEAGRTADATPDDRSSRSRPTGQAARPCTSRRP